MRTWGLLLCAAFVGFSNLSASPSNDNRSAAVLLSGLPASVSADNIGATLEANEAMPGNIGGSSVWYRWTSPSNGWVKIHTLPGNPSNHLDTVIALHAQGGAMLGFNDEDLDSIVGPSSLVFHAESGKTYDVGVYGYNYDTIVGEDPFELHIESVPEPAIWVTDVSHSPKPVHVLSNSQDVTFEIGVISSQPLFSGLSTNATLTAYSPDGNGFETSKFNTNSLIWGGGTNGRYTAAINVLQGATAGDWPVEISLLYPDGTPCRWSPSGPDLLEDHFLMKSVGVGYMVVSNAPLTGLDAWRQQWFQTLDNSGEAANNADFDHDGFTNFLEFALARNPKSSNDVLPSLTAGHGELIYRYSRSVAALASGYQFQIEWNDSLSGTWQTGGISDSQISDDGTTQTREAVVPFPAGGKRFIRLRVYKTE